MKRPAELTLQAVKEFSAPYLAKEHPTERMIVQWLIKFYRKFIAPGEVLGREKVALARIKLIIDILVECKIPEDWIRSLLRSII